MEVGQNHRKCLQESCTAHGFQPVHVEVSNLQKSTAFDVFFLLKAMKAMKIDEAAAMKGCLQALKALVLTLSQLYSQILAVFRAISTVNVESFKHLRLASIAT